MPQLSGATNEEIIRELQWRALRGNPVTCRCPRCTRTDALVVVDCADHGAQVLQALPKPSEWIRGQIVDRLRAANDGQWWGIGCDSGLHSNTGRCHCDGGEWRESRLGSGQIFWEFWLPGAADPYFVEDALHDPRT